MLNVVVVNSFLLLVFLISSCLSCVEPSVTYDEKAIVVNGQRRILISGSIHYPRSFPEINTCNGFYYN
ncbi:hypothetical protein Syun_011736 [Stephania yunnanensis]|uniref:Beta-galactosidase n=1 Tax=Stephania yunnanensis TaxID=152371 RepID=A0AAP0JYB3_9MAGN